MSSYVLILYLVTTTILQTSGESVSDNLLSDQNIPQETFKEDEKILSERDQGYTSSHIGDPKEYLDHKILQLNHNLLNLITKAKQDIEDEIRFTLLKKNTQGYMIVAAGVYDVWGDYVSNNYQLTTTSQLYSYGFLIFYGMGFGFPALVGNPPKPPIDCDVGNWLATQKKYGLSAGPTYLASQYGVKAARSLINEFDTWARLELACILDEEDNQESAAEVKWTLDNLIAAYNARLDL